MIIIVICLCSAYVLASATDHRSQLTIGSPSGNGIPGSESPPLGESPLSSRGSSTSIDSFPPSQPRDSPPPALKKKRRAWTSTDRENFIAYARENPYIVGLCSSTEVTEAGVDAYIQQILTKHPTGHVMRVVMHKFRKTEPDSPIEDRITASHPPSMYKAARCVVKAYLRYHPKASVALGIADRRVEDLPSPEFQAVKNQVINSIAWDDLFVTWSDTVRELRLIFTPKVAFDLIYARARTMHGGHCGGHAEDRFQIKLCIQKLIAEASSTATAYGFAWEDLVFLLGLEGAHAVIAARVPDIKVLNKCSRAYRLSVQFDNPKQDIETLADTDADGIRKLRNLCSALKEWEETRENIIQRSRQP